MVNFPRSSSALLSYILTGLQTHLRKYFPVMHRLYLALSSSPDPPSKEQIDLASGVTTMDAAAAAKYLGKVQLATADIVKSMAAQARKTIVSLFRHLF